MNTNKKYTVILSAEVSTASADENLESSVNLELYLKHVLKLNYDVAIGHYQGSEETSFIIHTDSSSTAEHLISYATRYLNQECVLISYNAKAEVKLYFSDYWKAPLTIGSHFVPNSGDGENYTRLNGKAWSVAA